jgi:hypothetical protein
MKTVFLRALDVGNKAATLLAAIREPKTAIGKLRFDIDPGEFSSIPTSPFAYWVSPHIRKLFSERSGFENRDPERRATKGLATTDDEQFLRVWWELDSRSIHGVWSSFARGGPTSPFYADLSTYVLWENDGARLKAYLDHKIGKSGQWSRWINSTNYYGRAGVTWALRAPRFSPQALPKESVFSVRGYAAFAEERELSFMLGVFNSSIFDYLFKLALGRFGHPEFVVGVLQWLPWAENGSFEIKRQLGRLASRAWELKRGIDTRKETSHAFVRPALTQVQGETLEARAEAWTDYVRSSEAELAVIQREIDTLCFDLYQIISQRFGGRAVALADVESDIEGETEAEGEVEADADEDLESGADASSLAAELISWAVGVAFGRFDVRYATGAFPLPAVPDAFDPLPVCSPGMLTGDDALPVASPPKGYPCAFPENGILVDDPGQARDLTSAVRTVIEELFKSNVDAWWEEVAILLDPKDREIRAWIKTSLFSHLVKSYSKSRRKAPLIWQLSIPSGRYSVWVYIHRLTRDSFFQIQNDIVIPKLGHEERQLTSLIQGASANPSAKQRKEIAEQEAFVDELRYFLEEIKHVALLWNPSLDDGVVLTAAPLWRLIPQHKPWQRELKNKWDELAAGKLDWAHVAKRFWPERVVPKCATDRSLAIAHGMGRPRPTPTRSINDIVREDTSVAVKATLKELSEASAPTAAKGNARRSSS